MSELNKKYFNGLDVTCDELDRISTALKDDEFKKLFFNYCQELQDPENRQIFEKEITQLESDRGVEVTFLNPIPGFVVKTSVDGKSKGFINIATSDKIDKPIHEIKFNNKTGKNGLSWSVPYAQAPASRCDYDNRKEECLVYDVLFHPDALKLAEKNSDLRKHIIDIACAAVEREFKVKLDQTNLKFPKMKFKGIPRATVIRRIVDSNKDCEDSPLDEYMPPKPTNTEFPIPKIHHLTDNKADDYAKPKYLIKHRRGVDYSEMTNELDAKLNITIPKELIIEIELPLLKSTSECVLDVTVNNLYLISEKPAKYQLRINLPYNVDDKNGSAKFDINTRKLIVQLPVIKNDLERKIKDLCREDSGVESDIKDEQSSLDSPIYNENPKSLIEIIGDGSIDENESITNDSKHLIEIDDNVNKSNKFLLDTIEYNYPSQFNCNILDDNLCFVINIKNVDPQSIDYVKTNKSIHIKFISIGSGYYPVYYSFYCQLDISNTEILNASTEVWDNNVILTLTLLNNNNLKYYSTGLNEFNIEKHEIYETFENYNEILKQESTNNNNYDVNISVKKNTDDDSVELDIKPNQLMENHEISDKITTVNKDDSIKTIINKKQKKKNNKKQRSFSESACYDVSIDQQHNNNKKKNHISNNDNNINNDKGALRKVRSFSESRSDSNYTPSASFKGILKHYSRYDNSYSASYSSMDEQYSCSADMIRNDSFDNIPEENNCNNDDNYGGDGQSSLSESCKKTVRFSSVIHKQLFRLDSSILGQKKKNQKRKNQKQRALQRRNSEGDSTDYDDKRTPLRKDAPSHDSGVDLAELNKSALRSNELHDSELSDIDTESKNYMFHIEI